MDQISNLRIYQEMIGQTIERINGQINSDEMIFLSTNGDIFKFYHLSDCCETVSIHDIIGDLDDLIGSPIVEAEEVSSEFEAYPEPHESFTWTFYKYATAKGSVVVRWLGTSNGYYSENVNYDYIKAEKQNNDDDPIE